MEDFVADGNGYCFFCLEICSSQNISGVKSGSSHSLQYLSRYLTMNRKKIFNNEESIPPDLLAKVEKSRLTSELCDECGHLNKQFSKLFRKLEMTELRIASCLDRIHKKLLAAEDAGKTEKYSNDNQSEAAANGKRRIVQALRREAMDNSFKKLNGITPRVKLRKLQMKDIHQKKLNLKLSSFNGKTTQFQLVTSAVTENYTELEHKIKTDVVEEEHRVSNSSQFDDDSDHEGHDMDFNDFSEGEDGNEAGIDGGETFEDGSLPMTSTPDTIKHKISYEGKFIKSNSGKYICKDCSKEYSSYRAFNLHYRGNHLNIKFRCVPCGKEFAQQVHFNNHQRSVHQRVRFKCDRCDSMCINKASLDRHRRSAHFGGRFPCNFCSMTFENFKDRNKHMKVECQSKRRRKSE